MTSVSVPTSGLAEFVAELACKYGVRYVRTGADTLADVITRLADDVVVPDDTEDLIVALKRAQVIDGPTMIVMLGNYLDETRAVPHLGMPLPDGKREA